MIVGRWLYPAEAGQVNELAELLAAELDRGGFGVLGRLYVSRTGQMQNVVLELEFESLADYEKRESDYLATPEGEAVAQKLGPLLRSPMVTEFWRRTR